VFTEHLEFKKIAFEQVKFDKSYLTNNETFILGLWVCIAKPLK